MPVNGTPFRIEKQLSGPSHQPPLPYRRTVIVGRGDAVFATQKAAIWPASIFCGAAPTIRSEPMAQCENCRVAITVVVYCHTPIA
jgi:hypothetical protein